MRGLVYRSTGSWYEVEEHTSKKFYSCRLAGKMKLEKAELTNPLAVGDQVEFEPENETNGIIHKILPRKNYIVRQSPKSKYQLHLIAANIDQLILVTTLVNPDLKPGFIDRFLLSTESQNIPVILLFNKSDLNQAVDTKKFEEFKLIYEDIGYTVLKISCLQNVGIELLENKMMGLTSLFCGQSGVGKSSVINKLVPDLSLRTGLMSTYSGKGTHTTTFAEMFYWGEHSRIIDTPGIKSLSFNNLEIMDVAHNFREFFKASAQCKFGAQCTHRNEPACHVIELVRSGLINAQRYLNYITMLDEIEAQNYWERKKTF
ncbi:MAG: ribosome small subunit-dependent GTPase A [Bacteroidota bacterium]|nr:ribosome small subunit-dependent GTPase A [Bacteroidota bacterium]